MKITAQGVTTLVLGTAIIIPCIALGKVIGVGVGALMGGAMAYSLVDVAYTEIAKRLS